MVSFDLLKRLHLLTLWPGGIRPRGENRGSVHLRAQPRVLLRLTAEVVHLWRTPLSKAWPAPWCGRRSPGRVTALMPLLLWRAEDRAAPLSSQQSWQQGEGVGQGSEVPSAVQVRTPSWTPQTAPSQSPVGTVAGP